MKFFNTGIKIPRGEIHILKDRCKGCGFCVQYCPNKVLKMSENFNTKGYHFPEVKDIDSCICCNLCEIICPDFAIWCTIKEEVEAVKVIMQKK